MAISIVRLGSQKSIDEGIRIGTVRRPPRGVKKENYSVDNWFDTWLPELSPSPELMKIGNSVQTESEWLAFEKKFRKELDSPSNARLLNLLSLMSQASNFSIGCYCECFERCHRSVLMKVLLEMGAKIKSDY
ncbi:DUF488 family protein [Thalassomonas viridans]|uniref:DUF488 family protein n=1 Tax=Thalassomonas viridans TaxID=137584 RepID=A0AAE9Z8H6_9GAMM|nr:DUF488 family protein [Thalassomonas viridans]WDE08463.1 DUF488 family protein [Thalassomonas viridans]